jgi:hypothetical protein
MKLGHLTISSLRGAVLRSIYDKQYFLSLAKLVGAFGDVTNEDIDKQPQSSEVYLSESDSLIANRNEAS